MFLAAFEAYRVERMRAMRGYPRSEPTAYESIVALFTMVLEHARAADRPYGCMSRNEAAELAPHDEEIQKLVERISTEWKTPSPRRSRAAMPMVRSRRRTMPGNMPAS